MLRLFNFTSGFPQRVVHGFSWRQSLEIFWVPSFLRVCSRCFRSFAILLYHCLSCGALVSCHLLRALRFSVRFCFMSIRHSSIEVWSFLSGVACHAAF